MTTSATIRETITTTLEGQGVGNTGYYDSYINPVVDALTEKMYDLAEALVDVAVGQGLSEVQARNVIGSTGLEFRPEPEPEVEEEAAPAEPATLEERVETLASSVETLSGTVNQLVQLASNRLGVNL